MKYAVILWVLCLLPVQSLAQSSLGASVSYGATPEFRTHTFAGNPNTSSSVLGISGQAFSLELTTRPAPFDALRHMRLTPTTQSERLGLNLRQSLHQGRDTLISAGIALGILQDDRTKPAGQAMTGFAGINVQAEHHLDDRTAVQFNFGYVVRQDPALNTQSASDTRLGLATRFNF